MVSSRYTKRSLTEQANVIKGLNERRNRRRKTKKTAQKLANDCLPVMTKKEMQKNALKYSIEPITLELTLPFPVPSLLALPDVGRAELRRLVECALISFDTEGTPVATVQFVGIKSDVSNVTVFIDYPADGMVAMLHDVFAGPMFQGCRFVGMACHNDDSIFGGAQHTVIDIMDYQHMEEERKKHNVMARHQRTVNRYRADGLTM
jgi:hypothetical protein